MKETITIHCWQDMQQFGVNPLTGESCAFGMRLLCDLNEEGRALIRAYFGLESNAFADNWNTTVDGKEAVASVMLHRDSLKQLAVFALFRAQALAVSVSGHGSCLGCLTQNTVDLWARFAKDHKSHQLIHNPRIPGQPSVGDRNVHAATGRTA